MATGPYSGSASGSMTLTTIPRYFSQKPILTLTSKTETTATFSWSTSEACSQVQYKINNGSWVDVETNINKTSGTYTITGLTPNTSYNIYGDFLRKDSQQWSTWADYEVKVVTKTYNYPNCTSGTNFNIGDTCTLTIDNPLNKTYDLIFTLANNETITIEDLTGTTYTGFNDSTSINKLYSSIPNSNSGNYNVTVVYGEISSITTENAGTYNVTNSNPIFNDFDYADINSRTLALTNDSSVLIKGYSKNQITISTNNKATAQNSATMVNYKVVQGTQTATEPYSSFEVVFPTNGYIVDNNIINVYATDSRGNTGIPVTKTLSVGTKYIEYQDVVINNASISRGNGGAGETTTLEFEGTYWNNYFSDNANAVLNNVTATYEYKESNSSTWISGLTTLTLTKNNANYSCSTNIRGDISTGFDVSKSYNIRITVTDELSSKTYILTLGSGQPAIAINSDNGVAIGQKYDTNLGGALQVNGTIYQSGEKVLDETNLKSATTTSTTDTYNCSFINNLIESASPQIVTNSNGTAIKYDNGLMICYKELMLTMAVNSAWGSVYESGNISLGNFPVAFTTPPVVSISNAAKTGEGINGGMIEYVQSISTTSCGTITMVRPTSLSSANFKINIVAFGMWK